MQSERESIIKLCNPKSKVSCHYLIGQNGKILRLVKEKNIAWHAGKSNWKNYTNLNQNSLGIELVNKGHKWGYSHYPKKQILNLINLCKLLIKKYNIKSTNILGHSDIAPLRKNDPGEKFPWELLAKKKIGFWHDFQAKKFAKLRKKKIVKKSDKIIFIKNIKKIGYHISIRNKKSVFVKITKAFQRHFRSKLINGQLDVECLKISINLAKKCSQNT